MIESKDLELKQEFTSSFLKTVCAFANYGDGQIIFGIDDNGAVIGINKLDATCQRIENSIADNIKPTPDYELKIDTQRRIIILSVKKSPNTPYLYKAKTYIRKGISTREVDHNELLRLILAGKNESFDCQLSSQKNLSFNVLEKNLQEKIGIKELSEDILLTLKLLTSNKKYTYAAELLADKNSFPGIDIVKFGANINIFKDRSTYEHCSLLTQYLAALDKFKLYYTYEEVVGSERLSREIIPVEAFRESIANALVHRAWDVNAAINVSMFDNRVEITSPGSLPTGLSENEFLHKQLSMLRNPILADVFLKLRIIEKFGTGIFRIKDAYKDSIIQPQFAISENAVTVILPVFAIAYQNLSENSLTLLKLIANNSVSSSELVKASKLGKTKVIQILNQLLKQGYVQRVGRGRSTKYQKANLSKQN